MSAASAAAEVDSSGDVPYRLVVPRDWVRLPMDEPGLRAGARALLMRRFADQPRDTTATVRHELEEEMVSLARRPGAVYARMLLLMSSEVAGRTVSASCLVSLLPRALRDEAALEALAQSMAPGAVASVVDDLGPHRGVVVIRDGVAELPAAPAGVDVDALAAQYAATLGGRVRTPADEGGRYAWTPGLTRHVEVHLPVPDSGRTLLLSFATPMVPLFDPLTELFLTIACTVQWEHGDRWS